MSGLYSPRLIMKPRKPQRVLLNQGQILQNVGSLRLCGSPTSREMSDEEKADDPALFFILADETMLGRVIVAQHSPIRAPPAAGAAQPNTATMRVWLRLHFSISQKMANITLHCERLLYWLKLRCPMRPPSCVREVEYVRSVILTTHSCHQVTFSHTSLHSI